MQCLKSSEGFNIFDDLKCNELSYNDPSCNNLNLESNTPNLAVQNQDPQA